MKAYDLMKLAAENPQKYEGKKYRVVKGTSAMYALNGERFTECIIHEQCPYDENAAYLCIFSDTELEEIAQPVPFLEAAEAHDRGKTVICEICGFTNAYVPHNLRCGMVGQNGCAISANEIMRGKWYIKD